MRPTLVGTMLLGLVFALVVCLPMLPALAAEEEQAGATTVASESRIGIMAAGSQEDSLRSCLMRIPKDATEGQRMVAEQACERDQHDRRLIQAVPKRSVQSEAASSDVVGSSQQ